MRNLYFSHKRGFKATCPGDPMHPIRDVIVQPDGSVELEVIDYENTDVIIDSFASSCSLENILARFANGDTSALNRYQPIYMDVSEFPKTLAESQQQLINAENAFNALPVEVKQKFGSDWRLWLSQSGSEEWYNIMAPVFGASESDSGASESEVVESES